MKRFMSVGWVCASLALLGAFGCKNEPGPSPAPAPGTDETSRPAPAPTPADQPAPRPLATTPATQAHLWTPTEKPKEPAANPRVEMRIRQGDEDFGWIVIELDPDKAPITVANFLRYVDEKYFDGTIFHRVISDFMIQGGGFTANRQQKLDGLHEEIQNECMNGLSNLRGTISMARTNQPHSATSQFFINVADNNGTVKYNLDRNPPADWGYAVFGKVVEGMEVVDRIKNVPTIPSGERSAPVNPPMIVTAQRVK